MYEYLAQHPEVFLPPKEVHFFGSDLHGPNDIQDQSTYLKLFAAATNELRVGEASVWYLYSRHAAKEIKQFAREASIIISLRNPVDMIYSLHSQMIYNGIEDIQDFEKAWQAETSAGRVLSFWKRPPAFKGMRYREAGKYCDQVERYLNVFGWEKVKINIFDDFKQNPLQVYRETCEFLRLRTNFEPETKIVNPNKKVRSLVLQTILLDPPEFMKVAGKLVTTLSWRQKLTSYLKELNTKYLSRPPMSPKLRSELQDYFASDVERLSKLLDRDLTYWCRSHGSIANQVGAVADESLSVRDSCNR
jgi:hypothetical protein